MGESFPPPVELIPHSGRAVVIDEVVSTDGDSITVAVDIGPTHSFYVAGRGVPAWAGLEMMAQALASHSGLGGRDGQATPHGGMLLGTRRYTSTTPWFTDGSRLLVHARREFGEHGGMGACTCHIECNGEKLAEATLIIVEEDMT